MMLKLNNETEITNPLSSPLKLLCFVYCWSVPEKTNTENCASYTDSRGNTAETQKKKRKTWKKENLEKIIKNND